MKALLTVLAGAMFWPAFSAKAQDKPQAYMSADLVSAYLWRGQRNTGVAIQPVLGVKWKGADLYLWGNEQLCPPAGQDPVKHEIDIFLKYQVLPGLKVGFKDVYVSNRGRGFLSYGPIPHAANGLDVLASYSCKWFSADWTTTIAGYDGYDHHGHRAYGSYLILSAPFHFSQIDWSASVGIVPYYCSRYDDDSSGFHVNMVALKAGHTFKLNQSGTCDLTPYGELMINPSNRNAFFMAGVSLRFRPSAKQ